MSVTLTARWGQVHGDLNVSEKLLTMGMKENLPTVENVTKLLEEEGYEVKRISESHNGISFKVKTQEEEGGDDE